jgi:hypothetical protein
MMECRNHGKIVMLMLVVLLLQITTLTFKVSFANICSGNANVVKQKKTRNGNNGHSTHPVRFHQGRDGKRESGVSKSKPGTRRISNETKCPIHPNGNHAWVDCYQNVANKDKKKPAAVPSSKGKGKSKSAVVDTNSMQCNDNKSLT